MSERITAANLDEVIKRNEVIEVLRLSGQNTIRCR